MTTDLHLSHVHTARCWWNPDEARWVCRPPAQDPDQNPDRPLVDVRDMLVVHTALLREFRLAPAAVHRVRAGDVRQARAVDRHLAFVCDLLHHHHHGEDTLLWPRLRARVPAASLGQLDAVEAQHAGIEAALQTVDTARSAWTDEPSTDRATALATALSELYELLRTHLDHEERAVLPLAAVWLSDEEWHAIGSAAAAAMAKPALVLAIGMFAYEGDPAVLATMLASAPTIPRVVVPRIGPRVYARRARQVYGTATP